METGDQLQVVTLHRLHERRRALHGLDLRQEGVAALLRGFKCGRAPFLELVFLAVRVHLHLGALADEGHDSRCADLGRLAHDRVHELPLRQGLAERDGVGQRFDLLRKPDLQPCRAPAGLGLGQHFGISLFAQRDRHAAPLEAARGQLALEIHQVVDGDEVVGLGFVEFDFGRLAIRQHAEDAEVRHRPSERAEQRRWQTRFAGPGVREVQKRLRHPVARMPQPTYQTTN